MIIKKRFYYFETLFFFALIASSCENKDNELEKIDKTFVTKKSASMYSDPKKRDSIEEIPAFVNLKSSKKMSIKRAAGIKTTYFEVTFNNKKGWVSAIYLVEIKNKKTDLSEKNPKNSSNKKTDLSEKTPKNKDSNYFYSVQIGSFKDKKFASSLVIKTKKLGFDSRLEKFNGNSGNWYRVRIGKYKKKKEAVESVNNIRIKFPSEPWVVELSKNETKNETKKTLTQYYTVQIKSFKDYSKAKKFSNSITKTIKENIITPININNQIWYRVHTKNLKMISEAKNLSGKINKDLKVKSWISNTYK